MEARIIYRSRAVWKNIRDFLAAHTVSATGSVLFLLLAIFLLWPVFAILVKSAITSEGFTLQYYKEYLSHSYYYRSFFNTLLLGFLTASLCTGSGFCIAYITTRGPIHLRRPLKLIALSPLVAPPFIFAIALIILLGRNGIINNAFNLNFNIYGFTGVVIAQTLAFLPYSYMMIENTLSSLNPNLEDSAANLGATEGKILRSITLPLLIPGFLKAALIVFVMGMAEFGNQSLLGGRTPFLAPDTYIMIVGEGDFNMASVLSMFLILPCVGIFIIQAYLIKGKSYTTIGGKPVAAEPRHISPIILIPMIVVSFIVCSLVLAAFIVIVTGAFTRIVGVDNTLVFSYILDTSVMTPLANSTRISLLAGLFGAIIGILLAYVVVRGKFKGSAALEGMGLLGFALPGTVVGIGYILAFNSPPLLLTGTTLILVICCMFRFLPVGMEAGIIKLKQLSVEIEEASLNLGAGTITTFRRIVLPIIFPAFMYGFIFCFIISMKSLSSVIFIVSAGLELVSIYIFNSAMRGHIGLACSATIKLIVIICACLAILQYLSKWTGLSVTRKA